MFPLSFNLAHEAFDITTLYFSGQINNCQYLQFVSIATILRKTTIGIVTSEGFSKEQLLFIFILVNDYACMFAALSAT